MSPASAPSGEADAGRPRVALIGGILSNRIESNRIESNRIGVEWSGVGWSGAAIDERAIYSLKYAMRFRTLSSLLHQSGTSDAIGYLLSALVNR
jgi:hypothetical protein